MKTKTVSSILSAIAGAIMITSAISFGSYISPSKTKTVVVVIPYLVPVELHNYSSWAKEIQLALDRTEYLRVLIETTCKPDGYGVRTKLPDPPPGWPATKNNKDLNGAWSLK